MNVEIPAGLHVAMSSFTLKNPEYLLLYLPFAVFLVFYITHGRLTKKNTLFLVVRLLILAFAVIAVSNPVLTHLEDDIGEAPPVTILVDSSPSMGMYKEVPATGYLLYERLRSMFQNLTGDSSKVKIEFFSKTNSTAIGDAFYSSMVSYPGEQTHTVLISDGRTNSGRNPVDMARLLAKANSTIYTVEPEKNTDDVYIVDVLGDKKVPSNIKYDLVALIGYTGSSTAEYELRILVDGIEKYQKIYKQDQEIQEVPFEFNLKDVGIHEIVVSVERQNDAFTENNIYYKPVEVVPKPKILVVTKNMTSPMLDVLKKLYDVDASSKVDNDYAKYAGVLFDNINADEFPRDRVNKIKKYI
ncbi:MAG: hypothetical protein KKD39_05250, partial [Candidatus Altiarchaeota archaeon]|nr:hypothetical protein [Candidatus Altiarchaeota archaeon]